MRVVVLIVDGLGIGEMDDVARVRPQDIGANTLLHVAQSNPKLELPNLERLGLGNLCATPSIRPVGDDALGSYGVCRLQHSGADSFMGHQELMGTIPLPSKNQLMREVGRQVQITLEAKGYRVAPLADGVSCLLYR